MLEIFILIILICFLWNFRNFLDKFLAIILLLFTSCILGSLLGCIVIMLLHVLGLLTLYVCLFSWCICVLIVTIILSSIFIKNLNT